MHVTYSASINRHRGENGHIFTCFRSILVGLITLIGSIALFTAALSTIHYDARFIMCRFWFVSLPTMILIFATGFVWNYRRRHRHTDSR